MKLQYLFALKQFFIKQVKLIIFRVFQLINQKSLQAIMSQDRQFADKLQDLFHQQVHVQSQQAQEKRNNNGSIAENAWNLNVDNANSLALYPRLSIQKIIPLSKNMLSEDYYQNSSSSESNVSQDSSRYKMQNNQNVRMMENQQSWLANQLGLDQIIKVKKIPQNTKNVLRNFGNAQNQYVLYNKQANNIVQGQVKHPQKFYQWVRQMKLQNFDGFKKVWLENQNEDKSFKKTYKKICWIFYKQTAIPYVLSSRMKNSKTKMSHLKYIYRFLQGIKNPQEFSYFKKIEK